MLLLKNLSELRKWRSSPEIQLQKIGFVPTMGALHEGHLTLIRDCKKHCDLVVVSIFVNPTQFGPGEDFEKYPRQLKEDMDMAFEAGASAAFAPIANEFYSSGHQSFVVNTEIENLYCGKYRPGHFKGVLTVVAKLFLAVQPQIAVFGKKDYQQAYLIKRMVKDLNFPIEIMISETHRESNGLAMSSRNRYLSSQAKSDASIIYQSMLQISEQIKSNQLISASQACQKINDLISSHGADRVQYVELVSPENLLPLQTVNAKTSFVILVAAYYEGTRLIDNLEVLTAPSIDVKRAT